MHFKYSHILTLIYVTFMYGLFLPILFPIAAFGVFNMYIVEKLGILYIYRKPPSYDNTLSRIALRYLKGAPILMFLMSYWAFGNTAIFFNKKDLKVHNNAVQDPHHKIIETAYGVNQTHMILLAIVFFFSGSTLLSFIKPCIPSCLQKYFSELYEKSASKNGLKLN